MSISKNLTGWAASVGAGLLAGWLVKLVWRAVAGAKPPSDRDDLSRSTMQVTAFAAVLAAATTAAQTLAKRRALMRLEAKTVPCQDSAPVANP